MKKWRWLVILIVLGWQTVYSQVGEICQDLLPSRLVLGRLARVLPDLPNRIRIAPSTESTIVNVIPVGETVTVIDGPECTANIAWWYVSYNGRYGWTAEGQGNTYWLEPIRFGSEAMNITNTHRVQQIGVVGRGYHSDVRWSEDGAALFVESEGGTWQYDPSDLQAVPHLVHSEPFLPFSYYTQATYSANHRLRAVKDEDEIYIEDTFDNHVIAVAQAPAFYGYAFAFSHDNTFLAIGGCAAIAENHACLEGEIIVWNVAQNTLSMTLRGHNSDVSNLIFSPDDTLLISQSRGGTAIIWDAATGSTIETIEGTNFLFSENNRTLFYTVGADIHIWHVRSRSPGPVWRGHAYPIRTLSLSSDGYTLASGDWGIPDRGIHSESTVRLWNVRTGNQILNVPHGGAVLSVVFSPSAQMFAAISWEVFGNWPEVSAIKVWTISGTLLATIENTEWRPSFVVAFSPDETRLAVLYVDGALRLYDLQTISLVDSVAGFGGRPEVLKFSPDGTMLAEASRVWDMATGAQRFAFPGSWGIAFSPNSQYFAVGGEYVLTVYNTANGAVAQVIGSEFYAVNALAYNTEGTRMAVCGWLSNSSAASVGIFDLQSGTQVTTLPSEPCFKVAYSPAGGHLATVGFDGIVQVWNAQTYELIASLDNTVGFSPTLAFSPDGRLLAYGGREHTIEVWDTQSLTLLEPFDAGDSEVPAIDDLSFSADGQLLVSVGYGQLSLWDTEARRLLNTIDGAGSTMAISPDSFVVATGSGICMCSDESFQLEVLLLWGIGDSQD